MLADVGLAWRLLTVIPMPLLPEDFDRPAGQAAAYYPLVGLILGFLLAGVDQVFARFLPQPLAAALLLAIWVGLTGMLHLDGFMDSCDGLLPPREPARRLEIMRDSRVGAFGVVGAVLLLLVKFNGLAALPGPERWPGLVVIPALGRWAMTWAMGRYPLARAEGLGLFFGRGLGRRQVALASLITVAATLSLFGLSGLILIAVTWATATLVARLAVARIGGLTGDVYGAMCELTEMVILITVTISDK